MVCLLCPKTALYRANDCFYCRDHYDQAKAAMRVEANRIRSEVAVAWLNRENGLRQDYSIGGKGYGPRTRRK